MKKTSLAVAALLSTLSAATIVPAAYADATSGDAQTTMCQGCAGCKGDQGCKGDKGDQGCKGDKGDQGNTGCSGCSGS